jgi:hypothetical protein
MTQTLIETLADFDTQIALPVSVADTTATLVSATDDDGVALPAGTYGFTIDAGSSALKEYFTAVLSGTALTGINNISRQGASASGFARAHRRGAKVTLTDWATLSRINNLLDGTTDFDSATPLKYDADPSLTLDAEIATKKYIDDVAIAGGADASDVLKGITKLSTAPASASNPIAVGDNDTRVPTADEKDALAGTGTPSSSNKYVVEDDEARNTLQKAYAADAEASDTYVITLSPAPTAYTAGMVINFKATTVSTGAATLNVNSLGAKTIKRLNGDTLLDGDIPAGAVVQVIYDGTDFILQSAIPNVPAIAQTTDPARAFDTDYQNTTGKNLVVYVILELDRGSAPTTNSWKQATALMDAASTPSVEIARARIEQSGGFGSSEHVIFTQTLTFIVPPDSYYAVDITSSGATPPSINLSEWKEQQF